MFAPFSFVFKEYKSALKVEEVCILQELHALPTAMKGNNNAILDTDSKVIGIEN